MILLGRSPSRLGDRTNKPTPLGRLAASSHMMGEMARSFFDDPHRPIIGPSVSVGGELD
jgi:hypothetical protein